MRRVEQAVILFSLLLQLALYRRAAFDLTAQQHFHQGLLLALRCICLWAFTCLPSRAWLRYRVLLIASLRIAIATVPAQRTAQEGDAVLLARPASPGPAGAAQDWLRLLTGTRLLPMALIGSLLYQPPLAVLAQQAALMWLTSANPAFCATQLLSDARMQRRLAATWQALEVWAPLLAGPLEPTAAKLAWLPEHAQRLLRCEAVLGWLQGVVGVMLPTLVAGCTAPPAARLPGRPPGQPFDLEAEDTEAPDTPCTPLRQGPGLQGKSRVQRAAAAACSALCRLDAALRDCCRGAGHSPTVAAALAAACCLLAGNLYALARGVAARRTAASMLAARAAGP
ncbi:hypothetical protein ABPG75_005642 [Micractinium tetrahymenae]